MNTLNETYRREGWGLVTDKALQIAPEDVESQARMVARWANDRITNLERALKMLLSDIEEMQSPENKPWFEGFSAYEHDDDETVAIEWPNLFISAESAKKTLELNQLDPDTGPYWDDCNPWKNRLIYVTAEEMQSITTFKADVWSRHGKRIDCYLLHPGPEFVSAGVRYGPARSDYISMHIDQQKAMDLYQRKN